jgi:hypothetical protein
MGRICTPRSRLLTSVILGNQTKSHDMLVIKTAQGICLCVARGPYEPGVLFFARTQSREDTDVKHTETLSSLEATSDGPNWLHATRGAQKVMKPPDEGAEEPRAKICRAGQVDHVDALYMP